MANTSDCRTPCPNEITRALLGSTAKSAGYPLPFKATVALGYAWQIQPDTGNVFFHSGIDLLAATGTQVHAVDAVTMAVAGFQGNYGNLVVVNHQGGWQSRYAQLNSVGVTVGQKVKKGELLGTIGSTGKPTLSKPHLHFEVRYSSSLDWVTEDILVFGCSDEG